MQQCAQVPRLNYSTDMLSARQEDSDSSRSEPHMRASQWRTIVFRPAFFGNTGDYKQRTQMHDRSNFAFPRNAPLATMHSARHTQSAPHAHTLRRPRYAIGILLCACTRVSDTCDKAHSKPDAIQEPVCRTQDMHAYKTTVISPCARGLRRPAARLLTSLQFSDTSVIRRRSLCNSSTLA
jgi:hypothetical protein